MTASAANAGNFTQALGAFCQSWLAIGCAVVLATILGAGILAPVLAPQNPYDLSQLSIMDARLPPGSVTSEGGLSLLGTDDQGRDLVSAMLYGLRTSLLVGIVGTFCAGLLGMLLGLSAGYFGGWIDAAIMRIVDIQLSFPSILVALILLAVLGQGLDKILIAIIAVQWAYCARVARSSAIVESRKEYVEAAQCLVLSPKCILLFHVAPNCLAPLLVISTILIANAIALEATLSFLGIGTSVTEPSLGLLIANGFAYLTNGDYWISVFPGLLLLLTIACINVVGDQIRDVLNPRLAG